MGLRSKSVAECCPELGISASRCFSQSRICTGKGKGWMQTKAAPKPIGCYFHTQRTAYPSLPPVSASTTCSPVDKTPVHSLLPPAALKEYILFLYPLASNPACLPQRSLGGNSQISWGMEKDKKKLGTLKNIFLGK